MSNGCCKLSFVTFTCSYARAPLSYNHMSVACLSIRPSHAGNASKLMITGSRGFHRRAAD